MTCRVLDVVPGRAGGGPVGVWATPPAPRATGRAFITAIGGRKRVRVLDRHRTDPWDDLRPTVLRAQLDYASAPPAGWMQRHAQPRPVPSDPWYG